MNKQDKKWVPEVGQECFMRNWRNHSAWEKVKIVAANKEFGWIGFCERLQTFLSTDCETYVKPIKTESEKRREEMIEEMVRVSVNAVSDTDYSVDDYDHVYIQAITRLYDAGWRKPKTLTESTIKHIVESKIKKTYTANDLMVAKAIHAYIRGELDL